ncbi:unnamed protein product [Acanthoscelides obtectus]|uniref:Uncharacterized protein n=2 Tax=Acanthoscelides obtectus TaxID=200917 RepID=A0A9P0JNG6_ACAOB|nr:unnamed protein product [Acanthoscelides obtectus]CAK1678789.1 hypothetical protein AOBTE_LOCUS32022 [Acanthoscelides obtectus]
MDLKRPRWYHFRLESESSKASEEDTESVYSLQDRETDVVRDTTDTGTEGSDDEHGDEFVIEYEVASMTESDNESNSSSGSELVPADMILAAAAAAICDSSLETWITDVEESDNSSLEDPSPTGTKGFSTCAQCRARNDNPMYRYCEQCFQDRKRFFPPRPRGKAKRTKKKKQKEVPIREPPVKLDTLRSCLSGLAQSSGSASQDSGISSSQDWPLLDLDQIVVPESHLKTGTSSPSTVTTEEKTEYKAEVLLNPATKRKRCESESSLSDFEVKKPRRKLRKSLSDGETDSNTAKVSPLVDFEEKRKQLGKNYPKNLSVTGILRKPFVTDPKALPTEEKPLSLSQTSDLGSEVSTSSCSSTSASTTSSSKEELCIFCNSAPKDSIFLHTNIAHQCCCYKCAKRTLRTIKRCPICNRSVNKVVKIFTA